MMTQRAIMATPVLLIAGLLLAVAPCAAASLHVAAVACNGGSTLFLMSDGTCWSCGENEYGSLGVGTTGASASPVQVPIDNVTAITSLPLRAFMALKTDGTVWAWGDNYWYGFGGERKVLLPVQVPGIDEIKAIKGNAMLRADGTVWELVKDQPPRQIAGLSGIVEIDDHVVLKGDGTVWTWLQRDDAVPFANLRDIVAISGDLALGRDGCVWTLFADLNGTADEFYQKPVYASQADISGVTAISSLLGLSANTDDDRVTTFRDASRNLALRDDGTVWTWGRNINGVIGDGTWGSFGTFRQEPVQLAGPSDVVAVSVSWDHALALTAGGTLWAWGENTRGERGSADVHPGGYVEIATGIAHYQDLEPTAVPALDQVVAVATGENRCYVLRNDGTLWAWGLNDRGQLGIGQVSPPAPGNMFSGGIPEPTKILPGSVVATDESANVAPALQDHLLDGDRDIAPPACDVSGLPVASIGESVSVNSEDIATVTPEPTAYITVTPPAAGNSTNGSIVGGIFDGIRDIATALIRMIPV